LSAEIALFVENFCKFSKQNNFCITSFTWTSIYNVAKLISKIFGNVPIYLAKTKDTVQNSMRNKPDRLILNYWKPQINLAQGISMIADSMEIL